MRDLPIGWVTDIAVLHHAGSTVECHDDHLIVRTPQNPTYHWGNFVLVTDPAAVDDAGGWIARFHAAFPTATWVAIGLARMPADRAAWEAEDVELELDEVLATATLPRQTPLPDGYSVRRLAGEAWEQVVGRALAENERTGEYGAASHERFVRARTRTQRDLCERGTAAFFGAFCGATLVSDLGIVLCGATARYQSVSTEPGHRRRGLASHLLGVAARWAAARGCNRWVIITEAINPAGRVYRGVGFEPATENAQAYRRSPR